jgi:hypothetical protein
LASNPSRFQDEAKDIAIRDNFKVAKKVKANPLGVKGSGIQDWLVPTTPREPPSVKEVEVNQCEK